MPFDMNRFPVSKPVKLDRSKLDGPLFPLQYAVYREKDGKRVGGADTLEGARLVAARQTVEVEIHDVDAGTVIESHNAPRRYEFGQAYIEEMIEDERRRGRRWG